MINFNKVRWKNFLSTGDRFTEIDLNNTQMTLIIGENGSGKSTLLDALAYGLFGRPFRKINLAQLVNSVNGRGMLVEVEFTVGTKEYKIKRGIWPDILEIYIDGELLDQEGKKKDTQEKFEKQILKLNYKSFTQIVVLGASSFLPFMQLSGQYRRDIIEDLLDIQIFSVMNWILKTKMSDSKNKLKDFENSISVLGEKVKVQEKYISEVKEINNDRIEESKKDVEGNLKLIEKLQKDQLEEQKTVDSLLESISDLSKTKTEYAELESFQRDIKKNVSRYNKDLKFFAETDSCSTCKQDILEDHKLEIVGVIQERKKENEEGLSKIGVELSSRETDINKKEKIQRDIHNRQTEIAKIEHRVVGINEYVTKSKEKIEYLEKVKAKSDGDFQRLAELEEELQEVQGEKDKLSEETLYYQMASELLKDTGIKTNIIKQYLPIMNKLINKHLSAMDAYFDFTLDENFNETIRSRFRDKFSYANFSEGEKMRIDLSLLFTWRAIAKLKNSASTNLLILDEVFDSSMDSTGTDEFMKLLSSLGDKINVFVISHKGDSLMDRFQDIIKFEKVGNFSKLSHAEN